MLTTTLLLASLATTAVAGSPPVLAYEDGKAGFIDKKGRFVIPATFDEASGFSEGFASVRVGELWGFVDTSGKWVVSPSYTGVAPFSEGLAAVRQGDKVGFVDTKGTLVIPATRPGVDNFHSGRARVKVGDKWGFIDTTGSDVIPATLPWAESFSDGLAAVSAGGQAAGYIDVDGKNVVPEQYKAVGIPGDGLLPVSKDGAVFAYVDYRGEVVLPGPYEGAGDFADERAWVNKGGQVLLIDTKGTVIPTPATTERGPFHNGYAAVRLEGDDAGLVGFIDTKGKLVVPAMYDDTTGFTGNLARVRTGLVWGWISKKNKVVWRDAMPALPEGVAATANAWVGSDLLQLTHWLGDNETVKALGVVGGFQSPTAAVHAARVHEGFEAIAALPDGDATWYVVVALSGEVIYREYAIGSLRDDLTGWFVVEPDKTAEEAFRGAGARSAAAIRADSTIVRHLAGGGDASSVPLVRSYGSLAEAGYRDEVLVHEFKAVDE